MKKAAMAYCRVSSNKQAQQGESLDDQDDVCRHIASKLTADIVPNDRIYKDAFSGRKDHRPEFDEAMEYLKAHQGEIDYFIVRDIDRLTRGGGAAYLNLKAELEKYGVELVDARGVIQGATNTLERHGFTYNWSMYSPSEKNEILVAQEGKDEVTKILTRLIGQEINLTQQGYRVRAPNDGFQNAKIFTEDGKKKTIQIPDPIRGEYHRAMFILRSQDVYADDEICKKVNAMGYKTPIKNKWDRTRKRIIGRTGGTPLTPKLLQSLIKRTAYCGIICEKWTHDQPIRTPYEGLVSIELFNKANRGKIYIQEHENGSLEILHNKQTERTIKRRSKHNAHYPYRSIVMCPHCSSQFKGSASKGKAGTYYENYHCSRGHKYFRVSKTTLDGHVETFIKTIGFSNRFKDIIESKLIREFRENQTRLLQDSASIRGQIEELETEKIQTVRKIVSCTSLVVQKELERQADELDRQIKNARKNRNDSELNENDIADFIRFAKHFMEHFDEMLLNTEDLHVRQSLFSLVFEERPTYDQIISGTPKLSLAFAKTKPQHDAEDLLVNHPPEMWNLILEELKQLYVLQTEENRAMAFAR